LVERERVSRKVISDLMHEPVITVNEDTPLEEVARTLVTYGIAGVPVVGRDGEALGVISNLDLVRTCASVSPEAFKKMKAREVMTPFIISVEPATSVYKAAELMSKEGIHRLFVLMPIGEKAQVILPSPKTRVVGVVSAKDILREITKFVVPVKVEDIMHDITLVDKDASISEAAKIMSAKEVGSILVAERNKPVGILTERDILKKVTAMGLDPKTTKINQIMTAPLITVPADASLEEASKIMLQKQIRRLPVTKDKKIVGMISARSMVGGFARYFLGKPALAEKKG